ncbi:AarF/ABC1/UbiB kinase family protein [Kitasatospora sp. NA04385]|uniref:ABC1 kinase family protein n=1 Tax=Kitasatospora sp. NA04385 TaxID=2742135 RepID=UPI0020CB15B7|nr:AarF/UbiB family protein [Kitasatospora sp. NA04385]
MTVAVTAALSAQAVPFRLFAVLVAAASFVAIIVGISAVSRRLLGIRVGPLRALSAGLVAVAASIALDPVFEDQGRPGFLTVLKVALAVLAAMVALVFLEVFVPYGAWAWPVQLWRATARRLSRAGRYAQLSRIFFRHGLGRLLGGRSRLEQALQPGEFGERSARSARLALEECGGAFIKLGQMLSTRRDLLPPHFVEELSRLQSAVTPAPWPEVEGVLRRELGKPVEAVFEWVEQVPLAAASIAQVHRAKLRDGPVVAVKVQRPGIREVVERDLDIVVAMTRSLQERARGTSALGLRDLGTGFAKSVREELDFRIEARNAVAVATASGGHDADAPVRIPRVYLEYTTAHVLVQEYLKGVTLDRAGAVADHRGLDRRELARRVCGAVIQQILRGGVFHADPHPGNILLLESGQIGLLDFGSVGRIDQSVQRAIREMLWSVDRGDPSGLHDALIDLLGVRATGGGDLVVDTLLLERELGQFMAQHLGVGARPDGDMFGALFQIFARFGLVVPPQVAAVFRAMATLEGTLSLLADDFNLLDEGRAIVVGQMADQLRFRGRSRTGGGAAGIRSEVTAAAQDVLQEAMSVLPILRRLPRRAERISASLEEGRLAVRVRVFADERERRFVSGLIHQMTVTLLAACTGLMGVLLLVFGTGHGPHVTRGLELFPLIGYQTLAVSGILMLRALYTAMRR